MKKSQIWSKVNELRQTIQKLDEKQELLKRKIKSTISRRNNRCNIAKSTN